DNCTGKPSRLVALKSKVSASSDSVMRCRAAKLHGQPECGRCLNSRSAEFSQRVLTCHGRSNPTPWLVSGSGGKLAAKLKTLSFRSKRPALTQLEKGIRGNPAVAKE